MTKLNILVLSFAVILISISASSKTRKASAEVDLTQLLATTDLPVDQEVCFSPEGHCDAKLIKLIQSAKSSIDMAIYDINHRELVRQLITQAKKISVRVLVDKRQSKETKSEVATLLEAGVNLRFGHQRGIMHNKFVIVDGKMIETGSYNFTNHATIANNENQIYLVSPQVVEKYRDRFEKIWLMGLIPADATRKPSDAK